MQTGSSDGLDPVASFGIRVRELRSERGMTQMQLGEKSSIDRAVIGFLERGEREIGISKVQSLASALGVQPGDLFKQPSDESVARWRRTKGAS